MQSRKSYIIGGTLLLFATLTLFFDTKEVTPEPFGSLGLSTYSEALKWVESNYTGETFRPKSSLIYKMVYYPSGKFMLIFFQSNKRKGYLYHNVPSSFWGNFKGASNIDRFYYSRIKGNKSIYLKLKKE